MEQQKINARVIKFLIRRISKDTPFSLMSRRPAVGADWLDGKSLNPRYMFLRCWLLLKKNGTIFRIPMPQLL